MPQIIAPRSEAGASDNPERRHETWLLTKGIVTLEQVRTLVPFMTGGGGVYRAQVVGYF